MTYAEDLRRAHKERQARFAAAALKAVSVPPEVKVVEITTSDLDQRLVADLRAQVEHWKSRYFERSDVNPQNLTVPIRAIKAEICKIFGCSIGAMDSARKFNSLVEPRAIAMHLCCILTEHSLPAIGRQFGNRDHTTVLHANRKIADRRRDDASFDTYLTSIENKLRVNSLALSETKAPVVVA